MKAVMFYCCVETSRVILIICVVCNRLAEATPKPSGMAVSGSTGLSFACGYNWEVYVVIGVSDTGNSQRMIEYKFSKHCDKLPTETIYQRKFTIAQEFGEI